MNKQDSKNLKRLARLADRNSPGVPPSVQRAVLIIIGVALMISLLAHLVT
jgi:hypothetical protein